MAKEVAKTETTSDDAELTAEEPKQGFVKKLLGNKLMLMIVAGGLLLVLGGGGAGAYFLLFHKSAKPNADGQVAADSPMVPPQVAYFNMPDLVVNIQSADGSPSYLKLSVALELMNATEKDALQPLMPRIVDQFQGYLRELRVDDLKGSAGVLRLKEELLRRTNIAASPFKVRDVLLKEMIVQ